MKRFFNFILGCLLERLGRPERGERPSAYIVMLGDKKISSNYLADPGIAMTYILLSAVEKAWEAV